jgi:hypothetical protein
MTSEQKSKMVAGMTDERDYDVISAYLRIAEEKLLRYIYPYDRTVEQLPAQYDMLHVEATTYLLNKRGGEGEKIHSENGISRNYEDGDLPSSLLRGVIPHMGVPK